MLFDERASHASLSYQMSVLLDYLTKPDPEARIRARCEELKDGVIATRYVPPDAVQVGSCCVVWQDVGLILCQGSSRVDQGFDFTQGWEVPIDYTADSGANPYLRNMATLIINSAGLIDATSRPRIIVAGHSLGGAASVVIAKRLNSTLSIGSVSCITYGAPRCGPSSFADSVSTMDIARWMCDDDPVPHVPPRQNEAPLYFCTMTNLGRTNANRYVQCYGGLQIFRHGEVSDADVSSAAAVDIQFNLGAWLVSLVRGLDSPHTISNYSARLQSYRAATLGDPVYIGGSTHRGNPVLDTPREIAQEVEATVRQFNQSVAGQSSQDVKLPSTSIFQYARLGKLWFVILGDSAFAIGPTRRKAGRLANLGNQFLRRLQTEGQVDTDSLVFALQSYLEEASDPTSTIKPTMRT